MTTTTARFRLSPQQRRAWALAAGPGGAAYGARCVLRLRGADAERVARALAGAAARHEVLRTVFRAPPGASMPAQEVLESLDPVLLRVEARGVEEMMAALDGAAPGLAEGPVLVAALAEQGDGSSLLGLRLSALSADEATLRLLARELAAGDGVAEPALQFGDASEVFNELLETEDTRAGREHWTRAARPAPAALPEELRAPAGEWTPRATRRALPREGVDAFAAECGIPAAAVLLGAWQLLLARLAGRGEVEVAVAFDGRGHDGLEEVAGPFARWLPLRAAIDGAAPFRAVASGAAALVAGAAEWQDYRDPAAAGAGPDFACAFDFADDDGVVVRVRAEPFVARLSAVRGAGGVSLELEYDAARLPDAAAERVAERLVALLDDALRRPDVPVRELDLLPAAERERVLAMARGPAQAPGAEPVQARVAGVAARFPDRPAVVCGGASLTFGELDARANRIARRLQGLGVRPGDRVAVCLERSPDAIAAFLGVLRAGAAFVPLDPAHPAERLAWMTGDAGARLAVASESTRGRVAGVATLSLDGDGPALDAEAATDPGAVTDPDTAAYVLFTSGSTGRPKGVVVRAGGVASLLDALRDGVYGDRPAPLRVGVNAPLSFDASVKQWAQLAHGHTLHLVPEEDRLVPARLLAWSRENGVEVLDCTPAQLRGLLAAGLGAEGDPGLLLVGGEAMDPALWSAAAALSTVEIFNVYGPTEFTVDATAARVADGSPVIGAPLAGTAAYVLDDALSPVALGAAGEVCLAGSRLALGYLGRPGLTAERFVPDPFAGAPGARMYRTGDRARWTGEGALEFLGRTDLQVKVRGVRIELGEVEAVLLEHPGVAAAAVAPWEPEGGERQLAAYVVPRDAGADADALVHELRAALRARLPEGMVPAALVTLPSLPLTPNGKVDRAALPDPAEARRAARAPFRAAESAAERTLARIWAQVLEVERVGVNDNFFDLGGNSLRMVQAHELITAEMGPRVTLVELFQHPTVALLARHLAGEDPTAAEPSLTDAEARARKQREALEKRPRPAR